MSEPDASLRKISDMSFDLDPYSLWISPQGLLDLRSKVDPAEPDKNVVWATDCRTEIPIIMTQSGPGAIAPITVMEWWKSILARFSKKPALSEKIAGKWQTLSYQEYYDLVVKFALGLVRLGISERSAVSILGYNSREWMIIFFGTIFANCVSCGHYLTNSPEAVQYVSNHSDSEVIAVDTQEQLDKVLAVWPNLPQLK
jgi:long-chain-fatty-acid--CoA ligase ACSBG